MWAIFRRMLISVVLIGISTTILPVPLRISDVIDGAIFRSKIDFVLQSKETLPETKVLFGKDDNAALVNYSVRNGHIRRLIIRIQHQVRS